MREVVTPREAAEVLGIHESRVRALIQRGELSADRAGRTLLIPRSALMALRGRSRPRGRRLTAENAWALLALLAGEEPAWVSRSSRYRLKGRARDDAAWVVQALEQSEPRAAVQEWHLLAADVRALLEERPGVLTGISIASTFSALVPSQRPEFDAYVDEQTLKRLVRRFRPVPGGARLKRNVTLRVPTNAWVLSHEPHAPMVVAAADLLDHPSERVRRTGREALSEAETE